mmetsp:Transcript_29212/g.96965  ORF Transcript_29212/g.96965 Transcript_29212/m.96965 type:complete len:228 (-) Transcript_29212:924-1607(-)
MKASPCFVVQLQVHVFRSQEQRCLLGSHVPRALVLRVQRLLQPEDLDAGLDVVRKRRIERVDEGGGRLGELHSHGLAVALCRQDVVRGLRSDEDLLLLLQEDVGLELRKLHVVLRFLHLQLVDAVRGLLDDRLQRVRHLRVEAVVPGDLHALHRDAALGIEAVAGLREEAGLDQRVEVPHEGLHVHLSERGDQGVPSLVPDISRWIRRHLQQLHYIVDLPIDRTFDL